jgi:hypothetical protein
MAQPPQGYRQEDTIHETSARGQDLEATEGTVGEGEGQEEECLGWDGRFVRLVQREERTLNRFQVWAFFHGRDSNSQRLSSCHDRAGL